MSASTLARRERVELAELMLDLGPDSPTLCEGWTTRDLAAHLVVREGRPDAAVGIVLPPLSGWTDRVQRSVASMSYPELIRKVRTGPPAWSVFALPGADGLGNLLEYLVHHEDVRRAQPDWSPRELPSELTDEVWTRLSRMARLMFRRVPVGVTLRRTDGGGGLLRVKDGDELVTLSGPAVELMLRSYGRTAVDVQVEGTEEAVAAFESSNLGI